jgi:hypothetical protein
MLKEPIAMKTQFVIAAAALSVAGTASAAFQITTSFATFAANVEGEIGPIPFGALGYGSGSGANAQAGTWGLTFNANSSTGDMASTASTVTVGSASGLQIVTFTFPSAGDFPVRGFGFYYTGGIGSPFTVFTSINGVNQSAQTIQNASNQFLGFYADNGVDANITSITLVVSANNSFTMTGSAFALVPAPGAVALLGVAGLVGSRRRR